MTQKDSNVIIYNNKKSWTYIHKLTQQARIRIAVDFLEEVLPEERGQKLLSVGCSTGEIERQFIDMGLLVYGVDVSPEALKQAKKRGIITKVADITRGIPYPDESFDFLFAGEVIEHFMHTREFLNEAYRVLKKKGVVIITTPNLARIEDRLRFLIGKTPKHTTAIHDYLYLHIRPFTLDSLKRALVFCGFEVEKYASNYVYFGPIRAGKFSRFLAKIFPGLGKTLIIRGRKI